MVQNSVSKIAILNDWFAPEIVGGVENSVSEYARELPKAGCVARVFTLNQPGFKGLHEINEVQVRFIWGLNIRKRNSAGVAVHVLEKMRTMFDVVTPICTLVVVKKYRPNFLILHEIDRFGPWLLVFARLFFRKKQLIRVHHDLSDTCIIRSRARAKGVCRNLCTPCLPKSMLHAKLSYWVNVNISNSRFIADELQSLGFNTSRSKVGNPVLIRESQVFELPIQELSKSVGFVGRITKLKGIETVFRAVSLLDPKWKVHLVGPVDEKYRLNLLGLAQDLRIEAIFHDPTNNPYRVISDLVDCIIVASESYEAFGKVPIEASLAGIPVISTEVGGLKESLDYIFPRPRVFPAGDSESLSRLLSDFGRPQSLAVKPTSHKTLTLVILESLGIVK